MDLIEITEPVAGLTPGQILPIATSVTPLTSDGAFITLAGRTLYLPSHTFRPYPGPFRDLIISFLTTKSDRREGERRHLDRRVHA